MQIMTLTKAVQSHYLASGTTVTVTLTEAMERHGRASPGVAQRHANATGREADLVAATAAAARRA